MVYNRQKKMKKILLVLASLAFSSMCLAQLQLATLEHDSVVSVYYGASALQAAHTDAVNGDIITLSPGMFTACDLTKSVTVRGAGMCNDTAAGVVRTVINGSFNIGVTNTSGIDSSNTLTLEGLYCGEVRYRHAYAPMLIKCHFTRLGRYTVNGGGPLNNAQVVNCVICNLDGSYIQNTMFVNSVIVEAQNTNYGAGSGNNSIGNTFTNCIIGISNLTKYHSNHYFYNCILYADCTDATINTSNNWVTSDYCIGINTNANNYGYYTALATDNHLNNYNSLSTVFKHFDGTYTDGVSFELQDNIAASIMGADGTQVGIYGGAMPFDPLVFNHKVTAARRTSPDGFLDLEIELYDE